MPDFIPVLIAAVLGLVVLMLAFGGSFNFFAYGGSSSGYTDYSKTEMIGMDFTVSYNTGHESVLSFDGEVNSGLFSYLEQKKEFEVENIGDVTEATVGLEVLNSNYYGNLFVFVNDKQVYKGAPGIGDKTISFDGSKLEGLNTIKVVAENSGWKLWAPTVYIFDMDVAVNYESKKTQSFEFEIDGIEFERLSRARLLIFGERKGSGNLNVLINGNEMYSGWTPVYTDFAIDGLKEGANSVVISTEPDTEYTIKSAQVVMFFE
ncbi:MAG: hypothetical protein JW700_04370 [Candidatus Aenigmarchaeota archaeon]|nr:hypothetical protein [Candidatus Aenigmarchaeota archaeon]